MSKQFLRGKLPHGKLLRGNLLLFKLHRRNYPSGFNEGSHSHSNFSSSKTLLWDSHCRDWWRICCEKTNSRLSTRIYKLEIKIVTFRSCKKDRTLICQITCHLQVSVIVYYLRRIQNSVNDPRWSFFVTTVNGNPRTQMVIRFSTEIKIESKNCNIPILIKEEI